MPAPEQITFGDRWVSAQELSNWLGCSERWVRELTERGVLTKAKRGAYDLRPNVLAYCKHLKQGSGAGTINLANERARLAKEQADAKAMENATARGDLLEREAVEDLLLQALSNMKTRLLAIPARAAPVLVKMKKAGNVSDRLRKYIHEALAELAALPINDELGDGEFGAGRAGGSNAAPLPGGADTAAGVDGKSMGGH